MTVQRHKEDEAAPYQAPLTKDYKPNKQHSPKLIEIMFPTPYPVTY